MQASAIAMGGIAAAVARFDASAHRTAQRPLDTPAEDTVERIEAKIAVQANTAVRRTADQMVATLLDIRV